MPHRLSQKKQGNYRSTSGCLLSYAQRASERPQTKQVARLNFNRISQPDRNHDLARSPDINKLSLAKTLA